MNAFARFLCSTKFRLFLVFALNVAIAFLSAWFGYLWIYFCVCIFFGLVSIFFLANRRERDSYKVLVFLTMFMLPLLGIGYAVSLKEKKGSKRIRKEWSDITYRNRKSVFQSNETMQNLKHVSPEAHKTCSYLVESVNMPCFQNANIKYYNSGEAYYKDLFEECKNAKRHILFECYKIKQCKLWQEFFDILRLKAREGVTVKVMYDDAISTKFISREDFLKMQNHGIETVPFNRVKNFNGTFVNYRNYKRMCIIDGKTGFFGGYNVDDEYLNNSEFTIATKDCAVKLTGESVRNLIVMYFEDYQFATKKVVNLQDYFVEATSSKSKDYVLPYSTNPVSLEHTSRNVLLSMVNNAKDNITITTSYISLDDELRNALIICARSGIKVRLIFSSEKVPKRDKNLARSYFYDLLKEGIEVYEYKSGKMTTKLVLIDNKIALISTNNLASVNTYRHFNAGIFVYGDTVSNMYNDAKDMINNSQLITIKDLQKRKFVDKINATWNKFLALFR